LGKTIRIDTLDYEIRGVVKDIPPYSSFHYDVLIPLAARRNNPANRKDDDSWGNFNYLTFVKLNPAASLKICLPRSQLSLARIKKAIILKQA
jgi:hypothetical protein